MTLSLGRKTNVTCSDSRKIILNITLICLSISCLETFSPITARKFEAKENLPTCRTRRRIRHDVAFPISHDLEKAFSNLVQLVDLSDWLINRSVITLISTTNLLAVYVCTAARNGKSTSHRHSIHSHMKSHLVGDVTCFHILPLIHLFVRPRISLRASEMQARTFCLALLPRSIA